MPDWEIGVILALIGVLCVNVGNHCVKEDHLAVSANKDLLEAKLEIGSAKNSNYNNYSRVNILSDRPTNSNSDSVSTRELYDPNIGVGRVVGTILFIIGNLLVFIAYGLAAQSLIASCECITFAADILLSKYHNYWRKTKDTNRTVTNRIDKGFSNQLVKEVSGRGRVGIDGVIESGGAKKSVLSVREAVSIAMIGAGIAFVGVFGNRHGNKATSDDMIRLYNTNYGYHGYLAVTFVIFVMCIIVNRRYYKHRVKKKLKLLYLHSYIETVSYALPSGIIGSQLVLIMSNISTLIHISAQGIQNEFNNYYLYVMLLCWVIPIAYWMFRLDDSSSKYSSKFTFYLMQSSYYFFSIMNGFIFYKELTPLSPGFVTGFLIGYFLVICGILCLSGLSIELESYVVVEVEEEIEVEVPEPPFFTNSQELEEKARSKALAEAQFQKLFLKKKQKDINRRTIMKSVTVPVLQFMSSYNRHRISTSGSMLPTTTISAGTKR